jgi:hypothetical protein
MSCRAYAREINDTVTAKRNIVNCARRFISGNQEALARSRTTIGISRSVLA